MIISRVIEVQNGDTPAAIRHFLERLLDERVADYVFAPVDLASGQTAQPQVIPNREGVQSVNPLLPIMLENAALALERAMTSRPQSRFAAVLRPCEVRAVIELAKRGLIDLKHLVIIGIDCLATYDADFYQEVSANHPEDPYWLMHEALRFARRGQIAPYRYRLACQLCDRPAADYQAADILLGLIGVKAREKVLVLADERADVRYKLHKVTDRKSTEREAVEREVALWQLSKHRGTLMHRRLKELDLVDASPRVIANYMSECTLCGDCIEACPFVTGELNQALEESQEAFVAALTNQAERLASCDGCGMCQAYCRQGVPLSAIHKALSQRIQTQVGYVAGRNARERLPRRLAGAHS